MCAEIDKLARCERIAQHQARETRCDQNYIGISCRWTAEDIEVFSRLRMLREPAPTLRAMQRIDRNYLATLNT